MLLSNATVDTLHDGILTLRFTGEGEARGFTSGDYGRDLGQALEKTLGVTPKIRAISGAAREGRPGRGGTGPTGGVGGGAGRAEAGGSGARRAGRAGTAARPGGAPQATRPVPAPTRTGRPGGACGADPGQRERRPPPRTGRRTSRPDPGATVPDHAVPGTRTNPATTRRSARSAGWT